MGWARKFELLPLHYAASSNTSVEIVRLILDTNPDACREKDQVWSVEGSHVYMKGFIHSMTLAAFMATRTLVTTIYCYGQM